MLIIPSDKIADDSFLNGILYGKVNLDQEIPIKSYEVKDRQLEYVRFSDGLTKSIPLDTIKNAPEKYIQQRTFYFGTDKYGRDLLSRLIIGTRISFYWVYRCVHFAVIGISLGAIAGYFVRVCFIMGSVISLGLYLHYFW